MVSCTGIAILTLAQRCNSITIVAVNTVMRIMRFLATDVVNKEDSGSKSNDLRSGLEIFGIVKN
jgi:hypothetical protein